MSEKNGVSFQILRKITINQVIYNQFDITSSLDKDRRLTDCH